jgi:Ca2+-binding RTX toxin-like protein
MGIKIEGTDDDDDIGGLEYDEGENPPEIWYDNEIYGYGGDDFLSGQWGNDVIFGGDGNDVLEGGADMDVLYGEEGKDYLYGNWGDDQLLGGDGNDVLYGGEDNDALFGGSGNDALDGGDGEDTAHYGDSDSGVTVNLAAGTGQGGTAEGDVLANIENLMGSEQDDVLTGNEFANELHGGGGADTLVGGDGADTLVGGDGNDTAIYQASLQGVVASLMTHSGTSGDAAGDALYSIENLIGSAHDDELTGDDGANTLTGGGGDDTLLGLNDDDELDGGNGHDILDGGKGIDKMHGGADDDTYIVDHQVDAAIEAAGEGALDRVQTSVTYWLAAESEIEVLETTDKAGSTAIDLFGNEFGNTIIGNAGANSLVGGMGLDVMTGNGGNDAFFWNSIAETADNFAGADVVEDFEAGVDVLIVQGIDANETNGTSDDPFEFIGTNPFTAPGQISYIAGRSETYILLNTDGDLDPEAVIRVVGQHDTVDSSWFVL